MIKALFMVVLFLATIQCNDIEDQFKILQHYNGLHKDVDTCFFHKGAQVKADCLNQTIYDYFSTNSSLYITNVNASVTGLSTIAGFYSGLAATGKQTWSHYMLYPIICYFGKIDGKKHYLVHSSVVYHATTADYQITNPPFSSTELQNIAESTWHIVDYEEDHSSDLGYTLESYAFVGGFWMVEPGFNVTSSSQWIRFPDGSPGWQDGPIFRAKACSVDPNGYNYPSIFKK